MRTGTLDPAAQPESAESGRLATESPTPDLVLHSGSLAPAASLSSAHHDRLRFAKDDLCQRLAKDDLCQWVAKDDLCQRLAKDDLCQRLAKDDLCQRLAKDDLCQRVAARSAAAEGDPAGAASRREYPAGGAGGLCQGVQAAQNQAGLHPGTHNYALFRF